MTIEQGYTPRLIGRIVELHAAYYQRVGFGAAFESKVASNLAEFVPRLDHPDNQIWHAQAHNDIVASIAIDGQDLGRQRAHLRWFVVAEALQGHGIGKALMSAAMQFCDARSFAETHLWTFKGLDAARSLYERHGFTLAEEHYGDQWGTEVLEQRFVRARVSQLPAR